MKINKPSNSLLTFAMISLIGLATSPPVALGCSFHAAILEVGSFLRKWREMKSDSLVLPAVLKANLIWILRNSGEILILVNGSR